MKILALELILFLALILAAFLRGRKTGRSALFTGALAVSKGLRWLAAFITAVATVIDEIRLWRRIECELRFQLAQDSFEAAELEERAG